MPIYNYRCERCDDEVEVFQPRHDSPPGECANCGSTLERILSSPSVNLHRFTSRSSERHLKKMSVEKQAQMEGERLKEHSKRTGIKYEDLFEVHDA